MDSTWIGKAVKEGWLKWEKGRRTSQVLFFDPKAMDVLFVEGEHRGVVAHTILKRVRDSGRRWMRMRYPHATPIKKRLTSKLNTWGEYPPNSYEANKVTEAVLSMSMLVKLYWYGSAHVAYHKQHKGGKEVSLNGYRFVSHSCMMGEDAGEVYDVCSEFAGCIGFIDPRDGQVKGRGNVWHLPDGRKAVEVLYNVPCTMAQGVTEKLREEGIIPLDEYFDSGGKPFSAGFNTIGHVTVGFCDYLSAQNGRHAMVDRWRYESRRSTYINDIGNYGESWDECPCGDGIFIEDEPCSFCDSTRVPMVRCEYCDCEYNEGEG